MAAYIASHPLGARGRYGVLVEVAECPGRPAPGREQNSRRQRYTGISVYIVYQLILFRKLVLFFSKYTAVEVNFVNDSSR